MRYDNRWIEMVRSVSEWSKDRSTETGCVIVDSREVLLAAACNSFPRGVADELDERHERPAKYHWTEHAERNAIYNAASIGIALQGSRLYVNWFPCADCARAIVQCGIIEVNCGNPTDHPRYAIEFEITRHMLHEAGVNLVIWTELGR